MLKNSETYPKGDLRLSPNKPFSRETCQALMVWKLCKTHPVTRYIEIKNSISHELTWKYMFSNKND